MKDFIENLISVVATMLIVVCFGIAMPTTLAILVAFVLVRHLVGIIVDHIKEKKMPSIVQWVQYALELVTVVLVVCGINYTSVYCLIFGLVTAVAALVCSVISNKKVVAE